MLCFFYGWCRNENIGLSAHVANFHSGVYRYCLSAYRQGSIVTAVVEIEFERYVACASAAIPHGLPRYAIGGKRQWRAIGTAQQVVYLVISAQAAVAGIV